jgi:hypothetical protein
VSGPAPKRALADAQIFHHLPGKTMGITDIGASASATSSLTTNDTVGITMLKKSLQIDAQATLQLISSIPSSGPRVDPEARLGQNIDVRA